MKTTLAVKKISVKKQPKKSKPNKPKQGSLEAMEVAMKIARTHLKDFSL